MPQPIRSTCRRHAKKQVRLKWVDMCFPGTGAMGSLAHATTCPLSPSQAHRSIDPLPKPTLQRQPRPTAENREAELSYSHLPGSPNESGTVAAGQRRAALCVLLRYQPIQTVPIKQFLKLWDEWTNLCLKRSVASRDVKCSLSVANGKMHCLVNAPQKPESFGGANLALTSE